MNNLAETLRAAKALIEKPERWGKGRYDCGGRYCAVGALLKITPRERGPLYSALMRALPKKDRQKYLDIEGWNDAPEITHTDVMALFDRAIAAAESESRCG